MIRIDYDEAIREANRLRQIASKCQESERLINGLLQEMPSYWQGEAAQKFAEKLEQWKQENSLIYSETEQLSKVIQRVANEIRIAEQRAIEAINISRKE